MAINYGGINPNYYNQGVQQMNPNWQYQPTYTSTPNVAYGTPNYNITTTPAVVPNQPYQEQKDNINWVQGEAGAKSFFVPSGKSVMLMDSEESVFYIKSVDASGVPLPLRIFDYQERDVQDVKSTKEASQETTQIDMSNYITREEFEKRINSLKNNRKGHNNGKSTVQPSEQ